MKILCFGNNGENTDKFVSFLAQSKVSKNNGLVDTLDFVADTDGYYHTSRYDLYIDNNCTLLDQFDKLILLDQPYTHWTNWQLLYSTFDLFVDLEEWGYPVEFRNNKNIKNLIFFTNQINNNKSFCLYPWITSCVQSEGITLCPYSNVTVHNMNEVKQKLLQEEMLTKNCKSCYEMEMRASISPRQIDAIKWATKFNINSLEDVESPKIYFYDLEFFNLNNVIIKKLNNCILTIKVGSTFQLSELLFFLKECVKQNIVNFDLTIDTNLTLSKEFLDTAKNFPNKTIITTIYGFNKINEYLNWGSVWENTVENLKFLQQHEFNLHVNSICNIYNIFKLHELYEFFDIQFPNVKVNTNIETRIQSSPFNFFDADSAIQSLRRCLSTKSFNTDTKVNLVKLQYILAYFIHDRSVIDKVALKEFFVYNDKLDKARGSRLGDYIPELEACRGLIA